MTNYDSKKKNTVLDEVQKRKYIKKRENTFHIYIIYILIIMIIILGFIVFGFLSFFLFICLFFFGF